MLNQQERSVTALLRDLSFPHTQTSNNKRNRLKPYYFACLLHTHTHLMHVSQMSHMQKNANDPHLHNPQCLQSTWFVCQCSLCLFVVMTINQRGFELNIFIGAANEIMNVMLK